MKYSLLLSIFVLALTAGTPLQVAADPGDAGNAPAAAGGVAPEKQVVIDLVTAFQAGDREKVESLWARDGGTWTDDEGFRKRASYFQKAEFDLDPSSIVLDRSQGTPRVIVNAVEDGQDYVWSFLVSETGGRLRAGGMQVNLKGMP